MPALSLLLLVPSPLLTVPLARSSGSTQLSRLLITWLLVHLLEMIWLMLEVTLVKPLALLSEPFVLWLEILLVLVGSLARWRILLDI